MDEPREGTIRRGEVLTLGADRGPGRGRGPRHQGATVATVERARRDAAVIRTTQGPPSSWRRSGRWHRCVIGGFLALRELQAEVDASAAVGGFVAATGSG